MATPEDPDKTIEFDPFTEDNDDQAEVRDPRWPEATVIVQIAPVTDDPETGTMTLFPQWAPSTHEVSRRGDDPFLPPFAIQP